MSHSSEEDKRIQPRSYILEDHTDAADPPPRGGHRWPLAAHPSPSQDAQTDPDPTVAGGRMVRADGRTPPERSRPPGDATVELDGQGVLGYRVRHNRGAHIGALAGHR